MFNQIQSAIRTFYCFIAQQQLYSYMFVDGLLVLQLDHAQIAIPNCSILLQPVPTVSWILFHTCLSLLNSDMSYSQLLCEIQSTSIELMRHSMRHRFTQIRGRNSVHPDPSRS